MFKIEVNVNRILKIVPLVILLKTITVISNHKKRPELIYVLIWSTSSLADYPFKYWLDKRRSFILNDCSFQNCYIVKKRDYFMDVTDYDAILFNAAKLDKDLPTARSDNQLYVFVAMQPSTYALVSGDHNWVFNYTWTYRLDSDVIYPYFVTRNRRGEVVGPKINAQWRNITEMKPTPESVLNKLKNKTSAVAWFLTNCRDNRNQAIHAHLIKKALNKYNLSVDVFGACGKGFCPKDKYEECLKLIERKYYFYLAFEKSICEDYVTKKLLSALDHYTVPVVLGGANYSRFMPSGIYLNFKILKENEIAIKINEAIKDKKKYYDYFRWRRYYTYHQSEGGSSDPLCAFCAFLNDDNMRNHRRVYARLDKWWNEYRSNNKPEDFIVKYEDSGRYIKSVVLFKATTTVKPLTTTSAPSIWKSIYNFFSELFNHYFVQ